jgi:NAD(P)-dependent dehydrogenase (short-subunit alcohol dehydrogenase family)
MKYKPRNGPAAQRAWRMRGGLDLNSLATTARGERYVTPQSGWAVILGASEGTGAAVARAVAVEPGFNIFGVHRGRHQESADALQSEIEATGKRVVMRVAEAGTADGAALGAEALDAVAGAGKRSVRLFVHSIANASLGRLSSGEKDQLVPRQIQKTFDSMAHSFVYWTQALLSRDLLAPGARLFGLTNTLSESMVGPCGLVAAAKAALESYVRCLAIELGPRGYRVNLLKFPTVVTPAVKTVYGADALERVQAVHRRMTPAGRMCTTAEVARFLALLAGDAGEWLNGATIDYSGGMTLNLMDLLVNPQ